MYGDHRLNTESRTHSVEMTKKLASRIVESTYYPIESSDRADGPDYQENMDYFG